MGRYARIESGKLREISPDTDETLDQWRARFHPSNLWVPYIDGANEGDTYNEGDGTFAPPPPPPIENVRVDALREIDFAAGQARARFITSEPGQESVYQLKREAAHVYRDAGYSGEVPAIIQSEANAQGLTPRAATDFIIATAEAWIAVAVQIEEIRQTGKVAVRAATESETIERLRGDALAALEVIRPA